jgi:predicted HTH transcriptional regulator
MINIFISSVQKELAEERSAIRNYIRDDLLFRRYFSVFLFEDLPAQDRRPDELYLDEVDTCSIYLGIFGLEYGSGDSQGISPTEREFDRATEKSKYRLVFLKGNEEGQRHPKMQALIRKAIPHVVRKRFNTTDELKRELYAALIQYLCEKKILMLTPFDESICSGATLDDISDEKIGWFIPVARKERGFPLAIGTPKDKVLTHLDLSTEDQPNNAAILLFGRNPQKFLPTSEIKCMHYHGTAIARPIPSQQTFTGTLFDQVDQATDFVLSKINRIVPSRDKTPVSETRYEISKEVIQEAIVNAVAHRDYSSDAGVQVSVFSDRIEIANPGNLPPDLTFEDLRIKHNSRPRNRRIARPLYFTHYIETIGNGTILMIDGCKAAGLPEPEFAQIGSEFVVTIWRDWLTDAVLAVSGLTDRQILAVKYVKENGRITNTEYQELVKISKRNATRDLSELVEKEVFDKRGTHGIGVHYVLSKRASKGPKGP